MIEALRYKLICFEIPVEGPAEVFCDNMPVVKSLSISTSVLNKRHNSIYYHRFREAQAAGIIGVGWILGEFNLSDLLSWQCWRHVGDMSSRKKCLGYIVPKC